ncbi:hypothetical protein FGIG_11291 [Fasciola gigantica]|uniref:Uncharacterized protein n=1 Tax=Fasciola gigantica TaxID=46835 RepID=A0A504Z0E2_FASGI|nr:hypothetical protein FGIG_11291 [Fasciola gigantica]
MRWRVSPHLLSAGSAIGLKWRSREVRTDLEVRKVLGASRSNKLFDIELAEFRVSLVASWSAEAGVTSLEEADSFEALTSLPDAVRVVCRKLDDGQFYFIPEPDTSEPGEEPEDMEQ